MSERLRCIRQARVHILSKRLGRLCDDTDPYSSEQLIELRNRFAVNAAMLKVPNEHKWILKLTEFFDSVSCAVTPRQRESQYHTIRRTYNEDIEGFKGRNPDLHRINFEPPSML